MFRRRSLLSDAELLHDGGENAMTQLVGRYERPLYRFLLRMTRDATLAEDLFQETFLRLYRYRSSFDDREPFKPYLFRIAVNVVRDARSRRTPASSLDAPLPGGAQDGASLLDRVPQSGAPPGEDAERNEKRTQVREAIAGLPDEEQEVVNLRVFEGLSFLQIAEATNVPVSTAKSRMRYALRRLRPVLEARLKRAGETI
jgi:RNA polymerase sigma-70 factor (ECF subfamily)